MEVRREPGPYQKHPSPVVASPFLALIWSITPICPIYRLYIVYRQWEHLHISKMSSPREKGNRNPSSHFGHGGNIV